MSDEKHTHHLISDGVHGVLMRDDQECIVFPKGEMKIYANAPKMLAMLRKTAGENQYEGWCALCGGNPTKHMDDCELAELLAEVENDS